MITWSVITVLIFASSVVILTLDYVNRQFFNDRIEWITDITLHDSFGVVIVGANLFVYVGQVMVAIAGLV